MSRADARGWGPGWPSCQTDKLTTVAAGGIRATVRKEVATIVRQALNETAEHMRLDQTQTGAFNCRKIARSASSPSNHSWGLAIDINWRDNPVGGPHHMPPEVVDIWRRYGWTWGGLWESFRDYMHFEFVGTPADAAQITATIGAPPTTGDDDMTDAERQMLTTILTRTNETADRVAGLVQFQPRAVRPLGLRSDGKPWESVFVVVDGGTGRRHVGDGTLYANLKGAFPFGLEEWNLSDIVAIPVIGPESPELLAEQAAA